MFFDALQECNTGSKHQKLICSWILMLYRLRTYDEKHQFRMFSIFLMFTLQCTDKITFDQLQCEITVSTKGKEESEKKEINPRRPAFDIFLRMQESNL